ncbi:hypothetical protein DIPPA_04278 [Diplonema papillatum]|nr:hypothetical protein DIPPA_04278 [Diplonema papillatum]
MALSASSPSYASRRLMRTSTLPPPRTDSHCDWRRTEGTAVPAPTSTTTVGPPD